jgi:hypothetical protein
MTQKNNGGHIRETLSDIIAVTALFAMVVGALGL